MAVMRFTTGLALLVGLGARILYNKFFVGRMVPGIEDHVLGGLWQGVALYYFIMEQPGLSFGVGFGMAARVLVNFVLYRDAMQAACTMLGSAVGVFLTDLLSQVIEDGEPEEGAPGGYDGSETDVSTRPRRLVQLRSESGYEKRHKYATKRRREFLSSNLPAPSTTTAATTEATDTTQSLESLADWIDPNHRLSPFEREVAALRRKATMADSERRRFKEEKKWAQEQGNSARANQMGWQVKRYAALMQSFHREADLRLLEATNKRHRNEVKDLRTAISQIGGPTSGAPALQHQSISLPAPITRQPSPPPLPTPGPSGPPGRQTVVKPSAIPRSSRHHKHEPSGSGARPRRSSLVNRDRDRAVDTAVIIPAGPPLPAGTSHTRNKSLSVLSRPSVRIEVHETVAPSSKSKGKQRAT